MDKRNIPEALNLGTFSGPVLIFGGPYSNYAATLAMLEKSKQLNIHSKQIICTGDVVAYCAQPEETTQTLINWGIPVVMGNCEESLGEEAEDCGCGFDEGTACAALSVDWYNFSTRKISQASRKWMRSLPRAIEFKLANKVFRVIHGSVSKINQFIFASTPKEIIQNEINLNSADVIVGGHSGLPFGKSIANKYWLNAGVIGMPANDGTADGWYMLLTPTQNDIEISWHRLNYDTLSTQKTMHKAGLVNGYADAITSGLWPSMDVLLDKERSVQGQKIDLPSMLI